MNAGEARAQERTECYRCGSVHIEYFDGDPKYDITAKCKKCGDTYTWKWRSSERDIDDKSGLEDIRFQGYVVDHSEDEA
jgi:transcription elongation factor Elf1